MKKIILTAILSVSFLTGYCQKEQKEEYNHKHEVFFWGGGGLSSIQYKPAIGDYNPGYGGNIGFGYSHFFNANWGLYSGIEVALYKAKTKIESLDDNYETIDDEDDPFTLLADIDRFEEKQQAYYFNIPLMLQYQQEGKNKLYMALGGKLGIPLSYSYKSSGDYLTRGKYAFTRDIFENMPEHGFGPYTDAKTDKKLKTDMNFQLSAEAGYKWHLHEDWELFTGVFCDYGLNDIRKDKSSSSNLFQYNASNPVEYTINSITQSHYTMNNSTENYTGKLNTFALGIKIKILYGWD